DDDLIRQWLLGGFPAPGDHGLWSKTTPLELELEDLTEGVYEYTLLVAPENDTDCGSSYDFTLTVYPPVPEVEITYEVVLCEPYTVELSAVLDPEEDGQFNWSNGDIGEVITVYTRGAYEVIFTDLNGCTATAEITVPHH